MECVPKTPASPQQCWCGSVHKTCWNDTVCHENACVPRCNDTIFMQREDCWCHQPGTICTAGQECMDDASCRDVILCPDPRLEEEQWEARNLLIDGFHLEFVETWSYIFHCSIDYFISDYVNIDTNY